MKAQVQKTINDLTTKVKEIYDIEVPNFDIKYSLRTGLGKVVYTRLGAEVSMKLNEGLLNEFGDTYIEEVVIHEFAHVVMHGLYPKADRDGRIKPHGREFKRVCRDIGYAHVAEPTTKTFNKSAHIAKVKRNGAPKFTYVCSCNEHIVSKTIHNKISRGSTYRCNSCKQRLVLKD